MENLCSCTQISKINFVTISQTVMRLHSCTLNTDFILWHLRKTDIDHSFSLLFQSDRARVPRRAEERKAAFTAVQREGHIGRPSDLFPLSTQEQRRMYKSSFPLSTTSCWESLVAFRSPSAHSLQWMLNPQSSWSLNRVLHPWYQRWWTLLWTSCERNQSRRTKSEAASAEIGKLLTNSAAPCLS